jgi:hypothetical protein
MSPEESSKAYSRISLQPVQDLTMTYRHAQLVFKLDRRHAMCVRYKSLTCTALFNFHVEPTLILVTGFMSSLTTQLRQWKL